MAFALVDKWQVRSPPRSPLYRGESSLLYNPCSYTSTSYVSPSTEAEIPHISSIIDLVSATNNNAKKTIKTGKARICRRATDQ